MHLGTPLERLSVARDGCTGRDCVGLDALGANLGGVPRCTLDLT